MSRFEHFLLSRFNMNLGPKLPGEPLDPEWLQRRMELFSDYCLPSIARQTTRAFRWLLFVHPDTPEAILKQLEALAPSGPFTLVYAARADRRIFPETVIRLAPKGTTHVITSRLDSDDGLALDYMETVQRSFTGQEREFVHFPEGYILSGSSLYRWRCLRGPFVSLIESCSDIETVHCGQHELLGMGSAYRDIDGRPSWVQVVHGGNLSNRVHGVRRPLKEALNSSRFALPLDIDDTAENRLAYWAERCAGSASEALRTVWRRLARRKPTSLKRRGFR